MRNPCTFSEDVPLSVVVVSVVMPQHIASVLAMVGDVLVVCWSFMTMCLVLVYKLTTGVSCCIVSQVCLDLWPSMGDVKIYDVAVIETMCVHLKDIE